MRWIVPDKDNKQMYLSFIMSDGNDAGIACSVTVQAREGTSTDLSSMTFGNQKCMGSDWSVSWGYMPREDVAVMTVVS